MGSCSEPGYFDGEALQSDLARLKAFYDDHGYPDASAAALESHGAQVVDQLAAQRIGDR